MSIQTTLPDPINKITNSGDDSPYTGTAGPGYKTVKVSSEQQVLRDKSRSGVSYRRINQYHMWKVDISYNKLTKSQFNTVYPFLLQRQAWQEAFFVNLPQYDITNRGTIATSVASNLLQPAGQQYLEVVNDANIERGDLITISDSTDNTHKKAYKITAVENNKLYISPTLQRKVDTTSANGSPSVTFNIASPEMRVTCPSTNLDYTVDSSGLYTFSVKLEETLS